MIEEYDDSDDREAHVISHEDSLRIGTIVSGLLFHTGVIIDGADTNEPTVEWWGSGHGIAKMPRRLISAKDHNNDSADNLHWFRVAVQGNARHYGLEQLPQHEVTKDIYIKALESAEAAGA